MYVPVYSPLPSTKKELEKHRELSTTRSGFLIQNYLSRKSVIESRDAIKNDRNNSCSERSMKTEKRSRSQVGFRKRSDYERLNSTAVSMNEETENQQFFNCIQI